jgi:hypothetical protein
MMPANQYDIEWWLQYEVGNPKETKETENNPINL